MAVAAVVDAVADASVVIGALVAAAAAEAGGVLSRVRGGESDSRCRRRTDCNWAAEGKVSLNLVSRIDSRILPTLRQAAMRAMQPGKRREVHNTQVPVHTHTEKYQYTHAHRLELSA